MLPSAVPNAHADRRALVVGGGLAGSAAAWWLHHTGWRVVLIDRETEPHPHSNLLQLDGTALDVLGQMGAGALVDDVASPSPALAFRWLARSKVRELKIDSGKDPSRRWRLAHRGPLLAALFSRVPGAVDKRLGLGLEAIEHRVDEVLARFTDGTAEAFDMVVGADGVHSTVRRLTLAPDTRSVYRNGVSHVWVNVDEHLPAGRALMAAHDRTFLQIYPYRGGGTSILAALPLTASEEPDPRPLLAHVSRTVEMLGPDLVPLAAAARTTSQVKLTRFTQVRLPTWHTRRVVLLGDSAYCIDPLSGLGAHASLLGAVSLAKALSQEEDVTAAFARYEQQVRPFTEFAQQVTAHALEAVTRPTGTGRPAAVVKGLAAAGRALPGAVTRSGRRRLAGRPDMPNARSACSRSVADGSGPALQGGRGAMSASHPS